MAIQEVGAVLDPAPIYQRIVPVLFAVVYYGAAAAVCLMLAIIAAVGVLSAYVQLAAQ